MPKKNKKRKRRLSREQLRQTMAPTKDFEWPNPHDADDIIIVTAQRLSPGHLLELDSSSLIKAYQQNTDESDANESQDSGEVNKDILDNFETIVSNVRYASEIASMAIIDPETGERIYTQEDCMLLLLPPGTRRSPTSHWQVRSHRRERAQTTLTDFMIQMQNKKHPKWKRNRVKSYFIMNWQRMWGVARTYICFRMSRTPSNKMRLT